MKLSTIYPALAIASAIFMTSGAALACEVVGYKNGERLCSTTYVYKRSPSYNADPSVFKKPAEQCRATCMRDAFKLGTSEQQAAYFSMCKRNKGCE